ncbi:hypothetical protein BpHYR1_045896 [Brachionus plicatilis]|uniref:Uncharacterized protein n=1 Tax=Brachionus plicatilis TaxID=10195 RepID=A0A3M7S777_BRAPC|nr:hypothetical protein BpHYR1_045896 [Brachionus plicatilis]
MKRLLESSRREFVGKDINKKLIRRFWRCLKAYKNGLSYGQILKAYFSDMSNAKTQEHLRISNKIELYFDFFWIN